MSTTLDTMPSPPTASLQPDRAAIWKRLMWKDVRELLPIWLTLIFGAAVCYFLINSAPLFGGRHDGSLALSTLICSQVFAVLACLFNGVLLFALEHENRTHQLLQVLPVQPKRVVWTKLALGLGGSILLIILFAWSGSFATWCASGSWPKTGLLIADDNNRQALLFIGPIAFFLISVAGALIAGSTVYAFVIAAFLLFIAAIGSNYIGIDQHYYNNPELTPAVILLIVSVGLLGIVAWQAQRWIEGRAARFPQLLPFRQNTTVADQVEETSRSRRLPNPFLALLWQSWNVAWSKLLLLIASIGIFTVSFSMGGVDNDIMTFFGAPLAAVGFLLLFSATVFLSDHQQGTYRFFQQHVERPHWFWLARLVPWWLTIAAIVTAFSIFAGFEIDYLEFARDHSDLMDGLHLYIAANSESFLSAGLVTALAIGQFWSMFVRNFAIAMVFSLITGSIVFSCVGWMVFLGVSLAWFLTPLVISLFWATWYRSTFWLADDRRWRRLVVPTSVIATTTVITFAGYIYLRANEIPDTKLDLNNIASVWQSYKHTDGVIAVLQFGTPESRAATAALYRQAIDKLDTTSRGELGDPEHMLSMWDTAKEKFAEKHDEEAEANQEFLDYVLDQSDRVRHLARDNQESIDLILKASQHIGCDPFLNSSSSDERWREMNELRSLMMANCLVLLDTDEHDKALESIRAFNRVCQRTSDARASFYREDWAQLYYDLLIRWSERPGQNVEKIKGTIHSLESTLGDERPETYQQSGYQTGGASKLEKERLGARQAWAHYHNWGVEAAWFGLIHRFQEIEEGDRWTGLSWAAEPQSRWEKQRAQRLLKLRAIEMFNASPVIPGYNDQPLPDPSQWQYRPQSEDKNLISTADRRAFGLESREDVEKHRDYYAAQQENARRYTLLRLALSVYAIENGNYPSELHQLAKYFGRHLPKTVHASSNFGWLPAGLPAQGFYRGTYGSEIVKPNVPVLLPFSIEGPVDTTKREKFALRGHDEDEQVGIPIPISDFEQRYTLNIEPYLVALPEGKKRD